MCVEICQRILLVSGTYDPLQSFLPTNTPTTISLAYFNEFAGEWGQILHRGKGKQLEFVKQVEKMMIHVDNNELNGCRYIGVESIFCDWKLYSTNKEL